MKERIADLLYKLLQETLTAGERQKLMEWAEQSPENRELLAWSQRDGELIERLRRHHAQFGLGRAEQTRGDIWSRFHELVDADWHRQTRRRRMRRLMVYFTAASLLVAIGVSVLIFTQQRSAPGEYRAVTYTKDVPGGHSQAVLTIGDGSTVRLTPGTSNIQQLHKWYSSTDEESLSLSIPDGERPQQHSIQTPAGGTYSVTLSDGTRVWLNAASSISYPTRFEGNERRVSVTGEVYLEVAPKKGKGNKAVPFLVDVAGRQTIEVKGTAFNIQAYTGQVVTTVTEGRVEVKRIGSQTDHKLLNAGQQATLMPGTLQVTDNVDLSRITAWKAGNFLFRRAPITEIMDEVSRWYGVEVDFRFTPNTTFTVLNQPRNVNLSELLEILAASRKLRFTIQGDKEKNEKVTVIVEQP